MKTAWAIAVLSISFYLIWNLGIGAQSPPEPTHNPRPVSSIVGGGGAGFPVTHPE